MREAREDRPEKGRFTESGVPLRGWLCARAIGLDGWGGKGI